MVIYGDKFENLQRVNCPYNEILVTDLTSIADWKLRTQVVKYVPISHYIGEFELIFTYAVMLLWKFHHSREKFNAISRAGETNDELVIHTI